MFRLIYKTIIIATIANLSNGSLLASEAQRTARATAPEHRVLIIANGGVSIYAALNELLYLERYSGKRIGELFDVAGGSTLAGSLIAAAIFRKDKEGQYPTIASIQDFLYTNHTSIFHPNRKFLCIKPKTKFNGNFLTRALRSYFGDSTLDDIKDKHVIIPIRNKRTTMDYMLSSHDVVHKGANNFYLRDIVRSSASTQSFYKTTKTLSRSGGSFKFDSLWPLIDDVTLPILLKLSRELNDLDWSHYKVVSVGTTQNARNITASDMGLVGKISEDAIGLLLNDNYIKISINLPDSQDGFFDSSEGTIRRIIHASNPQDGANSELKQGLDRYLALIRANTFRKPPRVSAIIVDEGRIRYVSQIPPTRELTIADSESSERLATPHTLEDSERLPLSRALPSQGASPLPHIGPLSIRSNLGLMEDEV